MLQVVRRNLSQGALGVPIFEIGGVTHPPSSASDWKAEVMAIERLHLGIALSGLWRRDWRRKEPCDFYTLKGLIESLMESSSCMRMEFSSATAEWAEPSQCAKILLEGRPIGIVGKVSASVMQAWDLEQDVWCAELSVEDLLVSSRRPAAVTVPNTFPPVKRDLSILVRNDVRFEAVSKIIHDVVGASADRIDLIDRFSKGPQLPEGTHSLTFSIEYRNPTRTLTASEADTLHQKLGRALTERIGATLR
jgi:phenylalanyl-tRNA synthetase beta chain